MLNVACSKTKAAKLGFLVLLLGTCLSSSARAIEIQLYDFLDTFGQQVAALQAVNTGSGLQYSIGIYDTGASVTTVSQADQGQLQLPTKPGVFAEAQAIGGTLIGAVGQPQTFFVDGLHNIQFDLNDLFNLNSGYTFVNPGEALSVPGVQAFIGTAGSASLPSIAGTPTHFSGKAARIDMKGNILDLGAELQDLLPGVDLSAFVIAQPDLYFVDPNSTLPAGSGTITSPFRIQLANLGENNSAAPGNDPSLFPNPVIPGITATHNAATVTSNPIYSTEFGQAALSPAIFTADVTSTPKTMLFDTGAQLSVISTEFALELGLDLNNPDFINPVQGAAGNPVILNGYILDLLEIPTEGGEKIQFFDAPVFVLDIGAGLDGIIGMNLFNTANQLLYDPFDASGHPTLSVTFDTDPNRGLGGLEGLLEGLGLGDDFEPEELALLEALLADLNSIFPAFGGSLGLNTPQLPGFNLEANTSSGPNPVSTGAIPEPSTAALCCLLGGMLMIRRRKAA